tara:strand:- start:902 stop:1105 length:204 start_codon:yes stop_codon:yes gene_type:complete
VGSINDPIMLADGLPLCDDHKSFWIDTKAYRAVRKAGGDAVPVAFKRYQKRWGQTLAVLDKSVEGWW